MNKIKQYFLEPRVSNSLLGMLTTPYWVKYKLENPDAEDEESKHYRIGSALDCLLTDNSSWSEQFEVVDAVRPYGLMAKFVDALPKGLHPTSPLLSYVQAYEASGYKTKLEKIVEKFWATEDFVNYYKLISASDLDYKTILSKDEYELVIALKSALLASEFTSQYFTNLMPHIELIHQQPIYFTYRNTQCKALLDGIQIDHKNKIIQLFDLKTTHKPVYDFPEAFVQWGYYRQAAFYREALNTWIANQNLVRDLSDYSIADFKFIVASKNTSGKYPPIIFQCTKNDLYCGIHGGYTHEGKYMRGINELIDALHWHRQTNNWLMPKWVYEQKAELILDTFKNTRDAETSDKTER